MTPLETFVDGHVICINLAKRADRWGAFEKEMESLGVTTYTRFDAYEGKLDGKLHGHFGCVASHRAVLEIIAWSKWDRCLVFEDDAACRSEYRQSFHTCFGSMVREVPNDWSIIYLGGHYGDNPIARVSSNVIQCGRMLTTSSYIITREAARRMAPHISGVGPIDILYSGFAERGEQKHYIFQPRLFIQSKGYSDLLEQETNNEWCMVDTRHETSL